MENESSTIGVIFFLLVELAVIAFIIAGLWKLFVKAGKPGWASIIPIYNTIVLHEIVGREAWKIVLYLIPFVNIYFFVTLYISLAKSYGKRGIGNYLAIILLGIVFIPLWGFSDEVRYEGPVEGPSGESAALPAY